MNDSAKVENENTRLKNDLTIILESYSEMQQNNVQLMDKIKLLADALRSYSDIRQENKRLEEELRVSRSKYRVIKNRLMSSDLSYCARPIHLLDLETTTGIYVQELSNAYL